MQSDLDNIENGAEDNLKLYVEANHPDIKISRSSSVSSLTDKILAKAYQTASAAQIKKTLPRVRAIINAQTQNVNYLSKRFQNLRKIIKERFGEKSALFKLHYKSGGLTHEQHAEKERMGKLQRDNRLANRTQITEKQAREILNRTSASPDVFDNILALQLATGARFIEAVRVSGFKRVPYSKNIVKVVGIAKRGEEGKDIEIDRPIFGMDIDELLELQEHVRRELKAMFPPRGNFRGIDKLSNDQVDKLLLANVNRRVKEIAKDLGVGVDSSHFMRKIYANMTHFDLPDINKQAMDKHHHIRTVLGHKNVETSASYANVKIKKDVKIDNKQDIEQKFREVDKVNDRQDKELVALRDESRENVSQTGRGQRHVELVNLKGEKVQIENNFQRVRGNAEARCVNIMEKLAAKKVWITEAILKKEFGFGSKVISAVSARKKELNSSLAASLK